MALSRQLCTDIHENILPTIAVAATPPRLLFTTALKWLRGGRRELPMPFTTDTILTGRHVRLAPLRPEQHDELVEAVCDGELWKLWYTAIPAPEGMAAEIQRRLGLQQAGSMLPFAVLDARGRAVGMTTYMNIDAANRRVEIGSTWYRQAVQRTPLNTECKRLLLGHAFETLDCIAVEFRTHFFNQTSRRAIERLGVKLDGVLRSHQINRHPDAAGSLRDTCVYSIVASEWPAVKSHLDLQLQRPAQPGSDS